MHHIASAQPQHVIAVIGAALMLAGLALHITGPAFGRRRRTVSEL